MTAAVPPHRRLQSRGSESGSIFHEDVWPPPGSNNRNAAASSSSADLSSIVDGVMGPAGPVPGVPLVGPSAGTSGPYLDPFATPPMHSRASTAMDNIPRDVSQLSLDVPQMRKSISGSETSSPTRVKNWVDRKPHAPASPS
jgi:hypothetical protein